MAEKKYLDKEGLNKILVKLEERYAHIEALEFKGTVSDIAHLPNLADQKIGWMYNVATGGDTTTADFVEGADKILRDGDNVVVVNVGTESDPILKWDIVSGVFKIEDRLQWGRTMPESPEDDQIFMYLGDTTYKYTDVSTTLTPDDKPSDYYTESDERPSFIGTTDDNGNSYTVVNADFVDDSEDYYYKQMWIMQSTDSSAANYLDPSANPSELEIYEKTTVSSDTVYARSTDTTVDGSKSYYLVESYSGVNQIGTRVDKVITHRTQSPTELGVVERTLGVSDELTLSTDTEFSESKRTLYKYVTPLNASTTSTSISPVARGLFEIDATDNTKYALTTDSSWDTSKTYYAETDCYQIFKGDIPSELGLYESDGGDPATYTVTADTYVHASKPYYTREEEYVTGVIYEYDATTETWDAKSSGDTFMRITEAEIDAMFAAL